MGAVLIQGKALAADVKADVRRQVEELKQQGVEPCLAVVLVGENPASKVYVGGKEKDCAECGIRSVIHRMPESTTQEELLELLDDMAKDSTIHGILVQLPLPAHIDPQTVIEAIPPEKDVDGFTPINVGKMMIGEECFLPCTPAGCIEMIEHTGLDITGKHAVVLGRSNIVGKPAAMLLLAKNATVTICHSKTEDLVQQCQKADILVAAIGKAGFVTKEMVKPGAVVVDVGINRNEEGKLCGDVAPEVEQVAGYLTPVPGGVGLMTRAMLMKNTVLAALRQKKAEKI